MQLALLLIIIVLLSPFLPLPVPRSRKKIEIGALGLALTFFTLLSGCGQVGQDGTTHVSISFKIPPANNKVLSAPTPSGITSITLEVLAPDMEKITKGISVNPGTTAFIDLDVPSGKGRKFLVKASGTQGNLLYQGETTSDLVAGVPTTVKIDMLAITLTLTMAMAGTGIGTVDYSPEGIDCKSGCTEIFNTGTTVTLTAIPAPTSIFAGWSGDPDCQDGILTMDANKSCMATFNLADTRAPDTTITAQPSNPTNSASAQFSFTSTETGSTFQCSLDAGAYTNCTSPQSYATLANGSHTFNVKATDSAGNTDATPASYTWTIDTQAPTVMTTSPANGDTGVLVGASITATFSEAMDQSTITPTTFTLSAATGTVIYAGQVATFTPSAPLSYGTTYTATITTGVSDLAGNKMQLSHTWSFTTIAQFTLTLTKSGTGQGTVTSSPTGINCGAACSALYTSGTQVTLTATPDIGSLFAGWSGDPDCTDGIVTMGAGKSCTATFNLNTYTITASSGANGSITPSGAVIVNYGGSQTFTITPNTGYHIADILVDGVSAGAAAISSGSYTFSSVTANHTIAASFEINTYTLSAAKSGTGRGTVTSSDSLINCGTACTGQYNHGTIVTLTATPDAGSSFTGWSGGGCTGTGQCSTTMTSDTTVTAAFSDTTPPDTSITNGPASLTNSANASFSFTGTDNITQAASLTFQCSLDAGAYTPCTSPQSYIALIDGTHTFNVKATDAAGNTDATPASYTWTIDTVAPITTATPAGGTYQSAQTVTLASNETATIYYTTDGTTPTAASTVYSVPINIAAATTLKFFAKDSAGNSETIKTEIYTIQFTLTLTKSGTGQGTVTSSPAGISCGTACSASFNSGTSVTLTATPDTGSTFFGWSGGGCTGTGQCTVTMTANTTVAATFNPSIVAISGGQSHTIALRSDGTVWAWGNNSSGQLGNNSTTNSNKAVGVSGLSSVGAVAGGFFHTIAFKSDGTAWAWGYNFFGQLGDNSSGLSPKFK